MTFNNFNCYADGIKHGGLSTVYETPEEAKLAFAAFHKMTFDGNPLKLQASKLFCMFFSEYFCGFSVWKWLSNSFVTNALNNILDDPIPNSRTVQAPLPFKINLSDPDASRRLYALHLSSSTDQTLLSSIFGSECIETVQLEADPFIASEKQAEVIHFIEIKLG